MNAVISGYGRLGQDPKPITTKTGKAMATASIAVDVSAREVEETLWLGIVAFGCVAETLLRHAKGDMVSVCGRVQISRWKASDGTDKEQWQVVADSLVSARTVRPGRKSTNHGPQVEAGVKLHGTAPDFDDDLPF
jgi:single-strand DNA-binding protein